MPERARPLKRYRQAFAITRPNVMLVHMKRTTLQIDPSLHAELRRRAAAEGRTLTEVLEQALRAGLAAPREVKRHRVVLPSYDLGPFLADPARPGRPPRPEELE
jgi:hypothetical protein